MARKLSSKEAKQRARRFCALRERSPQEVFDRIQSWGLSGQETQQIVDILIEDGFINEQRFAYAYCHDKFEFNSWGKQKIKAGIYPHKISPQIVEEALDRIDFGKYTSRLCELAKRKWDHLGEEDEHKKKQKIVSYLSSKGFELDLIWQAIHSVSDKSQ